jgi:hypothetical protein
MVHNRLGVFAVLTALLLAVASIGLAGDPKGEKKEKSRYLIEEKHTPEQCLKVLDDVSAKGSKLLSEFEWGCMSGDHTGYAIVEAKSQAVVKTMLPASMEDARIVKLTRFKAKEIRDMHQKQVGALDKELIDEDE